MAVSSTLAGGEKEKKSVVSKYDLTWDMIPFLDLQLVIPIFEFLAEHRVYDEKDLLEAKLELLRNTKMADYLSEIHEQLYKTKMPNHEEMRAAVVNEHTKITAIVEVPAGILNEGVVMEQLRRFRGRDSSQIMEYMTQNHGLLPHMVESLYQYSKFNFDCGDYLLANKYLAMYVMLTPPSHPQYLSALWGRLACSILSQQFNDAREDMLKLKEYIDNKPFGNELMLLQQRAYFIHWGLFVHFNHPKGREDIIDMFLTDNAYLNPIQILCPHILRYLTAAVILNRRRRQSLRDVVRVIELESYHYKDAVTEFIECLYIQYDFDMAQVKMRECEELVKKDFFLVNCLDDFLDAARMLTFEMYCRVNRCVSISSLSSKLGMTPDDTEKWVVNLIRLSRLGAKLESNLGHIIVGNKTTNVYEMVMEATKSLSFRAQSLGFQLEKNMTEMESDGHHSVRVDDRYWKDGYGRHG